MNLTPKEALHALGFDAVDHARERRAGVQVVAAAQIGERLALIAADDGGVSQLQKRHRERGRDLLRRGFELEPAAQQVATSFSVPFLELGNAAVVRGDQRQALFYLRRSYHLNPNPTLTGAIRRIETEGVQSLLRR